jgi:hypothetical protein
VDKRSAASLSPRAFFAVFMTIVLGAGGVIVWMTNEPTPVIPVPGPATNDPMMDPMSLAPQLFAPPSAAPIALPDSGPVTTTIADRAARDELRKRILKAWAENPDPKIANAAREGHFEPIPGDHDAGAAYIQSVVREQFLPLAKKCYEDFLTRKDAGGRIEMKFTIVGDQKIGGVVDDVDLVSDGGLDDDEMVTCMRESFLGIAFRPPPKDWVTVVYPIEFHP